MWQTEILCVLLTTATALGQVDSVVSCPPPTPAWTGRQLLRLSWPQLDQVYHQGMMPTMPVGFQRGRPIFFAGTWAAGPAAAITRLLWQGKRFHPADATQDNRLLGVFHAVRAEVYAGTSWLDGGPALILDYRCTRLFAAVRDEIREVAPGVYLGITFLRRPDGPRFGTYFVLETPPRGRPTNAPCFVGN